ncbi:MAG TPA: hypothetical protein VJC13_03645 [Candidatus Paceibacterota bacterium]
MLKYIVNFIERGGTKRGTFGEETNIVTIRGFLTAQGFQERASCDSWYREDGATAEILTHQELSKFPSLAQRTGDETV